MYASKNKQILFSPNEFIQFVFKINSLIYVSLFSFENTSLNFPRNDITKQSSKILAKQINFLETQFFALLNFAFNINPSSKNYK